MGVFRDWDGAPSELSEVSKRSLRDLIERPSSSASHAVAEKNRLQVWLDRANKKDPILVGHMKNHDGRSFSAGQRLAFMLPNGATEYENICLRIEKMGVNVTKEVVEDVRDDRLFQVLKDHNVPSYAESYNDPKIRVYQYSWQAIKIDLNLYESLFDHPDFEPA